MNVDSRPVSFGDFFDHDSLMDMMKELQSKYDFLEVYCIGKSIYGKDIPSISLGKGNKSVIYVGGHHGMEWITCALLVRFIYEFCESYQRGDHIFDVSTRVLYETRRIHIVPMLNPDGIGYAIHGVSKENVIYDRLLKMNNGSNDFSRWQANARGVDLNHNYCSGFKEYKIIEKEMGFYNGAPSKFSGEYPESEPETRALCSFVRIVQPEAALTLHTQGEEIFYTSGERLASSSLPIVKTLSRLTGYKISIPTGSARYGGFTDWFIDEYEKPSFTLECGRGTNPLPFTDCDMIYSRIKRALFTFPILI